MARPWLVSATTTSSRRGYGVAASPVSGVLSSGSGAWVDGSVAVAVASASAVTVGRGGEATLAHGVAHHLAAAGVTDVQHADHCTSCEPELYFSHRRDGGVTGRQAGIIVRDGS